MKVGPSFVFLCALLSSTLAHAQGGVTVLGGGYGQECYDATRYDRSPSFAIPICDKALDVDFLSRKDRAATHVNRGILKTRARRVEAAMKDFDAAIAIKPEIAEIYVNRGAALILLKRYDEAMNDLNKSLDMGAEEPKFAYYNRALAKELKDDLRGAYFDFKKALELDPEFADAVREIKRFTVTTAPKKS